MISIIGTPTQSGATSGLANTPTGAANGDTLLFFVSAYGTNSSTAAGLTSFTAPLGAVPITSFQVNFAGFSAGPTTVWLYRLLLTSTPSSTYTFTLVGDGAFGGTEVATICLRGPSLKVYATSANGNGTGSTNPTTPTLTTQNVGDLLVWYYWGENQIASAGPPSFTVGFNQTSAGNPSASSEGLWTHSVAIAGATGTLSATATNDDWIAMLVAVSSGASNDAVFFSFNF